jgi:hypothetical protein
MLPDIAQRQMETDMTRFFKIKFGNRRALVAVKGEKLAGFVVNKGGENIEHVSGNVVTTEFVVFSRKDIIHELRMNLHYAELEKI